MPLLLYLSLFPEFFDGGDLCRGSQKLGLGLGNVEIPLLVGEGFFGAFLRFYRGGLIEVIRTNCGVRKYRNQMRLHFQDATGNEEELFLAVTHIEAYLARLERRYQRRVAWRDANFTHHCGRVDHVSLAGEDLLFGTDDIYLNGVSHNDTLQGLRFLGDFFDAANHVKRLLRILIHLAFEDLLEARNRILDRYELAGRTGKYFRDEKRL
jgi:hypothetical protein